MDLFYSRITNSASLPKLAFPRPIWSDSSNPEDPPFPRGDSALVHHERRVEVAFKNAARGGFGEPLDDRVGVVLVGRAPFSLVAVAKDRVIKKSPLGRFLEVVNGDEEVEGHSRCFA